MSFCKIKRFGISLLLIFSLASCSTGNMEVENKNIVLHITDRQEMYTQFERYGGKQREICGFTILYSDPCEMWIAKDQVYGQCFWHELAHCYEGDYHG